MAKKVPYKSYASSVRRPKGSEHIHGRRKTWLEAPKLEKPEGVARLNEAGCVLGHNDPKVLAFLDKYRYNLVQIRIPIALRTQFKGQAKVLI